MKKKVLSLLLSMAMVLSLCACGSKTTENAETAEAVEEAAPVVNDGVGGTAYPNPLQDVRVRQAMWYAIDLDEIVEGLWNNDVTVTEGSLIPSSNFWYAEGLNDYTYNPEKAKELLAEAGWDGSYTIQGVYYTENLLDTILTIQAYWEAVGIKMEFEMLSDNLNELVYSPSPDGVNSAVKWDVCFGGTNAPALESFYDGHYTKTEEKPGGAFLPPNDEINALIDATKAATSIEEQKVAYDALQKYENENVPIIPLFHISSWVISSDKLDMKGDAVGNDQYYYTKNILDWTIDREDKTMYTDGGAVSLLESPISGSGLYLYQELVFDRLLNANADLSPSDGNLAESYEVSEDGKTITFTIRDGIKWHDGVDFTAEDVAWTFEYYKSISTTLAGYFGVVLDDATVAQDGNKVIFTFNQPQPNALTSFAQYPVLPKHLLEDVAPENFSTDTFWQNPVGTGPYKVDTVKLGEYTILARNNDYYKTGTGNIEKIYMYASNDTGSASLVTNCMAGNIDYAYVKDSAQCAQIRELDGYNVEKADCMFTRWMSINQFDGKAE